MYLELGVGDHEANGFVYLARWKIQSLEAGHKILSQIDEDIPAEAAGDSKTDPFTFFLDLRENEWELVDTGKKMIPLQMAQRLAPE
ncbi:hypothetical protein [Flexibacterium corallicola]|uniref:hypothetical protein n=1 Tax=Flexibacterium corallicola TaxID=3037259 RepID=UPI00286EBD36|nr:hypothetical protein [Pseudovibrio sp. M1P-2-3]